MGILHRLFGRNAAQVWKAETHLLHRLGFVAPPRAVQWICTSACELSCPHCYSHAGRKSKGELDTGEANRLIIDELCKLERPMLVLAGGEALLRRDFGKLVKYAHQLARRLRALFRVELDNEWGSAGEDDCFYRDSSFLCGAGRTSCVISATGEVMPCTTTDPSESQGNLRTRPLSDIWANGFSAFRSPADRLRSDCDDCWLQTRHVHSCRRPAFLLDLFDPAYGTHSMRGGGALIQLGKRELL